MACSRIYANACVTGILLWAPGVESIDLLSSKDYPGQNRGFAFVEFYNHACAQLAKNALSAPTYTYASVTLSLS